jgi:hypothetical protein
MIDRRDRENFAIRKMRNAQWEQPRDQGPVWAWFAAGLSFLAVIILSW